MALCDTDALFDWLRALAPADDPWLQVDCDSAGKPFRVIATVREPNVYTVKLALAGIADAGVELRVSDRVWGMRTYVGTNVNRPPRWDRPTERLTRWLDKKIPTKQWEVTAELSRRGRAWCFDVWVPTEYLPRTAKAVRRMGVRACVWSNSR